ncbi:MAG TPA: hypothetical protein VGK31_02330 [Thermoanaerobaculia bacterium]|jgi:hypothetical protein
MNAAYIHLALNNFPPILNLAGLCLLIGAMATGNLAVRRVALIVLICVAVIAVPTWFAGKGAEDIVKPLQGINVPAIDPHEEAATAALILLIIEGAVAMIALIVAPRRALTIVVLLLSIASTATVFYAARLGGRIHHPETQMRRG